MPSQDEPPRPGAHQRRSLALVDTEGGDCRVVHRPNDADPLPSRRESHVHLVNVGHHLLHKDLHVVLLAKRAKLIAGRVAVADVILRRLQADDLEGCLRRRSGLRTDHAPEASHLPRPHVVVLAADGDQVLFGEGDLVGN